MATSSSGPSTRPSLLLRLRDAHDREAWETFVNDYGPLVYLYCRRKGLQHADAEDVMQEVLAKSKRWLDTFQYEPDKGRFRGYFGTVAHHELDRFLRNQRRLFPGPREDDPDLEGVCVPVEDPDWKDENARHKFELAKTRSRPHFHAKTWQAFELVVLEDRSPAEVAERLGEKESWVYIAKSRVCKRIKEECQALTEDGIL